MNIKPKVEALISTFKDALNKFNSEKAKWEASTAHSAEFIHEEIRKLEQGLLLTANELNAALQKILQNAINEIRSKKADGNNFELQLSNALGFLNMIGDKLKDEATFAMVQPFFGDYTTMHNLSIALSGRQGIPATLFTVSGYDKAINLLKKMQIRYKTIFYNHQNANSSLANVTSQTYFMGDVNDYEVFLARLDKYLSASVSDAEKIVAEHSRFEFGLSNHPIDKNSSEQLGVRDFSASRTYQEMMAEKAGA